MEREKEEVSAMTTCSRVFFLDWSIVGLSDEVDHHLAVLRTGVMCIVKVGVYMWQVSL